MILSAISLITLYIAGLLNSDIMSIFNNIEVSSNAMKSTMMVGIFVYVIYIFMVYLVSNKLLNKGVNVD